MIDREGLRTPVSSKRRLFVPATRPRTGWRSTRRSLKAVQVIGWPLGSRCVRGRKRERDLHQVGGVRADMAAVRLTSQARGARARIRRQVALSGAALIAVAMTATACARSVETPSADQTASTRARTAASTCTPAGGSVAWSEPRYGQQITAVVTFDGSGVKRNTWSPLMIPAVIGGEAPTGWLHVLLDDFSGSRSEVVVSSPIADDLSDLTPNGNLSTRQLAYRMHTRVTADFVVSCPGGEVRGSIVTWRGDGMGRSQCSDLPYDPALGALTPFCGDSVDTAAIKEPLLLDERPQPMVSGGVLGPDNIGVK